MQKTIGPESSWHLAQVQQPPMSLQCYHLKQPQGRKYVFRGKRESLQKSIRNSLASDMAKYLVLTLTGKPTLPLPVIGQACRIDEAI